MSAELGKVPPGADCGATQKHFVFIRGFSVRKPRWPVQPHRHQFAAAPQDENRQRREECWTPDEVDQRRQEHRNNRHPVQINIYRGAFVAPDLCFGSSFPLKQALAGEHAADQRSHYGVHGNQHLVRQKDETEKDIEVSDEVHRTMRA